jgi:hypothetical protein
LLAFLFVPAPAGEATFGSGEARLRVVALDVIEDDATVPEDIFTRPLTVSFTGGLVAPLLCLLSLDLVCAVGRFFTGSSNKSSSPVD